MAYFNPEVSKVVAETKSGNESLPMSESSTMPLRDVVGLVDPKTFQENWNHPNPEQCMKWGEEIRKKFAGMNKLQVWHKIKQDKIPKERQCVK